MENSISKTRNRNSELGFVNSSFDNLFESLFRTPQLARSQDYRMVEHDESYEVMFDVPGADKENATVKVTRDNILQVRISTETSSDEDKVNSYSIREKSWNLSLGRDVDTENIQAGLERGVLSITLPKRGSGDEDGTISVEVT